MSLDVKIIHIMLIFKTLNLQHNVENNVDIFDLKSIFISFF